MKLFTRKRIYIIATEGDEFCKIGVSNNPKKRLQSIQNGNHLPLRIAHATGSMMEIIARQVEWKVIEMLGDRRATGEWFRASPDEMRSALEMARKSVKARRGNTPRDDGRLLTVTMRRR